MTISAVLWVWAFLLFSRPSVHAVAATPDRHYKTLGVPKSADEAELKRAHRKMCLKYHPDKNRDDPKKAETKFKEVQEAYEVLKDPQKRQVYDTYGEQGLDGGGGGGGGGGYSNYAQQFQRGPNGFGQNMYFEGDSSDLFRQMFQGGRQSAGGDGSPLAGLFSQLFGMDGGPGGASRPTGNEERQYEVPLTLEEIYNGGRKSVMVSMTVTHTPSRTPYNVQHRYSFEVSPGWKEGTRISFAPTKVQSDGIILLLPPVTLIVMEKRHRYFERIGDDLLVDVALTQAQAKKRVKIELPLLDGKKFSMVAGMRSGRIEHGMVREFPGRGMPSKKGKRGKLYVRFRVISNRPAFSSNGFQQSFGNNLFGTNSQNIFGI